MLRVASCMTISQCILKQAAAMFCCICSQRFRVQFAILGFHNFFQVFRS